jgi:hypothetical protein
MIAVVAVHLAAFHVLLQPACGKNAAGRHRCSGLRLAKGSSARLPAFLSHFARESGLDRTPQPSALRLPPFPIHLGSFLHLYHLSAARIICITIVFLDCYSKCGLSNIWVRFVKTICGRPAADDANSREWGLHPTRVYACQCVHIHVLITRIGSDSVGLEYWSRGAMSSGGCVLASLREPSVHSMVFYSRIQSD